MTTTVAYYLPEFTQGTLGEDSGMKLKLSKPSDRSAVNGSGDALLWAGQGWLIAVVGETWTESLAVSVEDADGLIPRAGWLGVGAVVVSDVKAELDSDTQAQIDAIEDALVGLAGTGARTVTITVNDGTTVLQNALVRITEGANTFTALTNSIGVAVFNLDEATYLVAITKSGYSYSGTSLVVNGNEIATYSMTAISVSNPTTGRVARRSIPVTVVDRVT